MEKNPEKFKTALVIDDEEIDVYLAKQMLASEKCAKNSITFNNAKLALSYLENIKEKDQFPDLILLDLAMPDFSGEDFLVAYHRIIPPEFSEKTKLVVLTAYKNFHEAKDINVERFPFIAKIMEKPLKVEEL